MSAEEYERLSGKIAVLKDVANEYPFKTIENIIMQMEATKKEVCNDGQSVSEKRKTKRT